MDVGKSPPEGTQSINLYFTLEWVNDEQKEADIVLVKKEDVGTASWPEALERFPGAAPPGRKSEAASNRAVASETINVLKNSASARPCV
ncbi:hypothetical protein A1F96_09964 [Pyrenophora tritici-repentis]|nr:hypothetical protein A1F96_09964 [Pyrenophora tritici-repentis]